MFISTNWLRRHVDLDGVDFHELGLRFTMSVAELEGVHTVGANLATVVVGHVQDVQPIEGKRIRLTTVDTGPHGVRQIVCGAPNVAKDQHVLVALPGTTLGDITIAEAKVGGIASAGMICSESELGLSDEHAGIKVLDEAATPGTPITELWDVADVLFEIDNKSLTHRPDLWGHRGIAREIGALLDRPLKAMAHADVVFTDDAPLTITVDDQDACPRYTATCMSGVQVAPSPMWLRLLLHRVGTRPISNIVDATNFVMLDLGNPLHAFDARELSGSAIVVRRATDRESFTTLDGQEHVLSSDDLLIADATRGVALAGVMGGENSEIRDDTTDIVLEAANFAAAMVRTTAQRHGIRTESSTRFEKSLDPELVEDAARSFIGLVLSLCPDAKVTSRLMDVRKAAAEPTVIELDVAYVEAAIGEPLGEDKIVGILEGLSFGVVRGENGALTVSVPTWRATKDVGIPADLVEEVGRVFGYDNITPRGPQIALERPDRNAVKRFEARARDFLSYSCGLDELQTYSFDSDPLLARIGVQYDARTTLAQPLSAEMPGMRRSLVPNLLGVLEKNFRQFGEIGVYELGRVFHPAQTPAKDTLPEQPKLAGLLIADAQLTDDPDATLFFRAKNIIVGLCGAIERPKITLEKGGVDPVWAHPARQARILLGEQVIGCIAQVHPSTLAALRVHHGAVVAELDLDALRAATEVPTAYTPLPKFPAVFRDFAVVVASDVSAARVRDAIVGADNELISEVSFQSIYTGEGIDEGEKSLAWSVTLRHVDRTLTEPEIHASEAAVWAALEQIGGRPRA